MHEKTKEIIALLESRYGTGRGWKTLAAKDLGISQVVSYAICQHVGQQSEETLLKDNNLAFLLHTQMIAHNNTADILRNLFDTEMNDLSMFDAENIAQILAESPPFAHEDEYTIANITE